MSVFASFQSLSRAFQASSLNALVNAGKRYFSVDTNLVSSKTHLVDTLDLMRKFEKVGFSREQSENLTRHIADILEESRNRIASRYVPKASLDKAVLEQEAKINSFSSELQKAQDLQLGNVVKETERLHGSLERMRLDVKHEIDKLTSSQRLDLNLEKGRMRDELHALRDKTNDLELKIDREINALKAAVELTKNETIKYVVAILGTFTAAGIGIARVAKA
ncbi:hypothetical protein BSKO_03615 [Bryopsis sp. KO-2023]|nr:hypothetical protein BSKO_03615 [Bryopsis sp. KO-2023]